MDGIRRKLWKGDLLNLAAGNSFWRSECVTHRAGSGIILQDCEEGDPLALISGFYWVKRSDLSELSEQQCAAAHAAATLVYSGLNGYAK